MSETTSTVAIDRTYYFDEHKRLAMPDIPDTVADITEEIDYQYRRDPAAYFQRVINTARPPVAEEGAPYLLVDDAESSDHAAVVVTLPYCNPVIPDVMDPLYIAHSVVQKEAKAFDSNTWNNPIKHAYLFDVLKALGVRDEAGNTLPVIVVGADSQDYQPKLTRQERGELRRGSLSVYRRNVQDILKAENIGQAHIAGYSQGGSVAHAVLAEATDIDVLSGTIAEASTYKERSIAELAVNYLLNKPAPKNHSGIKSEEKWTESGPQARRDLELIQNKAMGTMAASIIRGGAWRTAFALRHNTMVGDLTTAIDARGAFPLTIAWNGTSSLTHDIERTLFDPENAPARAILQRFEKAGMLRTVKALGHEAVGAPHLAGESPMYYALMIGESVLWAASR